MTRPFADVAGEFQALLDALCERALTPDEMRRFEEILHAHPEAEAHYVRYMSLYADLARHFAAPTSTSEEALRRMMAPPARGRRGRVLRWGALAGAALAAGLLLFVLLAPRQPQNVAQPSESRGEPLDHSVAVLVQAPGATWEGVDPPPRPGTPLPSGRLRLKSGSAHLEFYSGATVILEGPADFELISRTEVYCSSGKLRATVPAPAKGFTIRSPKLDLVDRGTEFGLRVGDKTEVEVFQGKVEVYDAGSNRPSAGHQSLLTGQGIRLDASGKVSAIKPNPTAFTTAQQLAVQTDAEMRRRHESWLAAGKALRQDPSLLVHFTFEPERHWSRTLLDAAGHKTGCEGTIVGCGWGDGRWPGKQGLEFRRVSDRVRFHVPGEFESLTLASWVRVDGLPNRNNSLMMCDGWEPGEPHWQIGDDGTLILGVQANPKGRGAHYHAVEGFTPTRFGEWSHLAVVYDRGAGTVTHYLDGRPASEVPIEFSVPLRIGDAELGNWNMATHRNPTPIRFLSGGMDEFMLFSRALSGHEIEQLHGQGRPPM